MTDKIKSWWSDDGKWFCLLINDGVNQATVSLTPEEAKDIALYASPPAPSSAETGNICYLQRSAVRQTLLGQPDIGPMTIRQALADIDAMPILTASDIAPPSAEAERAAIERLEQIAGMDLLALAAGLEDNLCHRHCGCPRDSDTPKDCIQERAANVLRAVSGQPVSATQAGMVQSSTEQSETPIGHLK